MKLMIASDIHGHGECCAEMFARYKEEKADKLIILGDLLYHGPRNGVFDGYDPEKTIKLLNDNSDSIMTVRGNCDCEVDQMVLDFPIMSEMLSIYADGLTLYAVHGHKDMPKAADGNIILSGHTHIFKAEKTSGVFYLNPGSISIPKNGNPRSYMTYSDRKFTLKELSGTILWDFPIE